MNPILVNLCLGELLRMNPILVNLCLGEVLRITGFAKLFYRTAVEIVSLAQPSIKMSVTQLNSITISSGMLAYRYLEWCNVLFQIFKRVRKYPKSVSLTRKSEYLSVFARVDLLYHSGFQ